MQGVLGKGRNTASVGLVFWCGQKESLFHRLADRLMPLFAFGAFHAFSGGQGSADVSRCRRDRRTIAKLPGRPCFARPVVGMELTLIPLSDNSTGLSTPSNPPAIHQYDERVSR